MTRVLILIAALSLGGCSALKDAAISALTGGSGGLEVSPSVEVIDGDKQESTEVIAAKTETNVQAEEVKEVSNNKQQAGTIVNNELSGWVIFLIASGYVLSLIFLCLPTPTQMYNAWAARRDKKWHDMITSVTNANTNK